MTDEARAVTEYTADVTAEHKEKKAPKVFSLRGLRLYECPLTYIDPESWEILRLVYLIDESKQLYYPGGWSEQPYWLVEALEIFKAEVARWRKKESA